MKRDQSELIIINSRQLLHALPYLLHDRHGWWKCIRIVWNNPCPCSRDSIYCSQLLLTTLFHPEGDAEEFALRIDIYANHGYFEPHETEALKKDSSRKTTPYAQAILRRFVDRYYS